MTVNEAIRQMNGKGAGLLNRRSVQYAQSQLLAGEEVLTAVLANVSTPKERFPGIVVLTDRRIFAVCGLPGVRRSIVLPLEHLTCQEAPGALYYKAVLSSGAEGFAFTVNPEVGERFSRWLAVLNGEEEAFDAVDAQVSSGIFNPVLARTRLRARQARDRDRARRASLRQAASKETEEAVPTGEKDGESLQSVAQRLSRQLEQAREKGPVSETDPMAVSARLAAELAEAESQEESSS